MHLPALTANRHTAGRTYLGASLEAGFPDSGKLTPECQSSEADTAHSDKPDVTARPSAPFASIVELDGVLHRTRGQLALVALPLLYFCFLSQMEIPDLVTVLFEDKRKELLIRLLRLVRRAYPTSQASGGPLCPI